MDRKKVLAVSDDLGLGMRIKDALASDHDVLVVSWPRLALDLLRIGGRWDTILCERRPKGLLPDEFILEVARIAGDQAQRVVLVDRADDRAAIRQSISA